MFLIIVCDIYLSMLTSSHPLSIFWLVFIINTFKKSNRESGKKVESTISCHLKSFVEQKRVASVCLTTTDVPLKSDLNVPTDLLKHRNTAGPIRWGAGADPWTTVWYHPDLLLLHPTVRRQAFHHVGGVWSDALLVAANRSLIWKHCRAAERHWNADQSLAASEPDQSEPDQSEPDLPSPSPVWASAFDVTLLTPPTRDQCSLVRTSVCVFTLTDVHSSRESTLENGDKEKERGKKKQEQSPH